MARPSWSPWKRCCVANGKGIRRFPLHAVAQQPQFIGVELVDAVHSRTAVAVHGANAPVRPAAELANRAPEPVQLTGNRCITALAFLAEKSVTGLRVVWIQCLYFTVLDYKCFRILEGLSRQLRYRFIPTGT